VGTVRRWVPAAAGPHRARAYAKNVRWRAFSVQDGLLKLAEPDTTIGSSPSGSTSMYLVCRYFTLGLSPVSFP
jgi:hypothetical protein